MATIKPFRAYRPGAGLAARVAALPYDVYDRAEAKAVVEKEPLSFLGIDRAETAFSDDVDEYADCVYAKARDMLQEWIRKGIFVQDEHNCFYIYELTMDGRSQTGIVGCASVDEYLDNTIKKHENTREEKELDRIRHVDVTDMQTGPIFLAYHASERIENVIAEMKQMPAAEDFVSEDGVRHRVWVISAQEIAQNLTQTVIARGAEALARAGVRHLTIADFDVVDQTNLNRQNYFADDIGKRKTDATEAILRRIDPDMEIRKSDTVVTPENVSEIFSGCSIVCEAFDRPENKTMLVESLIMSDPNVIVVSCSGMAGFGSSNSISTERRMSRLYVCGDGESDSSEGSGLVASRVMVCAGHVANMAVRLAIGNTDP